MKNFFTSLSIWTGAIVALLTIVDWLLTEAQKKSVKGWAEYAWLWLDDQKMGRFIIYLKSYKIQLALSAVTYISFNLLYFRQRNLSLVDSILVVLGTIIIVQLVSLTIHSKIILWAVNSNTLRGFFLRCVCVFIIILAAIYSLVIEENIFGALKSEIVLVWIPFIVLVLILSTEFGLIGTVLFLSLFWYCLILFVMALFRAIQFILFRVMTLLHKS